MYLLRTPASTTNRELIRCTAERPAADSLNPRQADPVITAGRGMFCRVKPSHVGNGRRLRTRQQLQTHSLLWSLSSWSAQQSQQYAISTIGIIRPSGDTVSRRSRFGESVTPP